MGAVAVVCTAQRCNAEPVLVVHAMGLPKISSASGVTIVSCRTPRQRTVMPTWDLTMARNTTIGGIVKPDRLAHAELKKHDSWRHR